MPVAADSLDSVVSRCWRRVRSRGPTADSTPSRSCIPAVCHTGNIACQERAGLRIVERMDHFDVIIIGGGAAGLSAAATLGRARRRVVVIDAGNPRNAPTAAVHGFLTRDGMPPAELLAAGRGEVERYGGVLLAGEASEARPTQGGFTVTVV